MFGSIRLAFLVAFSVLLGQGRNGRADLLVEPARDQLA